MNILRIHQLHMSFGATTILDGVTFDLQDKEHVALIGHNGAGKSTLLKIITGELTPDSGDISKDPKTRIDYLSQMPPLQTHHTVWEEAREVFKYVDDLERQWKEAAQSLSQADEHNADKIADKYARAEQAFFSAGGYEVDSRVRKILTGMGFPAPLHSQNVSTLSGGQKTRLQLAKLLLKEPGLLILDEPTNHLDLDTVEWLESYLKDYPGALLVVSHDRYFLDQIAKVTFELSHRKITRYSGNYSSYLLQKEQQETQLQSAFERQQEEIKRMEEFVAKNIARATTTTRAQSRRKALEKIERIVLPVKEKRAHVQFSLREESAKVVLDIKNLAIIRGGRQLFPAFSLHVRRGEKIAITGVNGVGKSSLLQAILIHSPDRGEVITGTKVHMASFEQEFAFKDMNHTVIEEIWSTYPAKTETEIRTRLGQLLFSGDEVYKTISSLSGGERNRLQLAILSWSGANLLLFDEPTNHLDIAAKEVLEESLQEYPGTLIFVSHDRYFINRIATRMVHLAKDAIVMTEGNYETFVQKRELAKQEETPPDESQALTSGAAQREQHKRALSEARKQQTRMTKLESLIATLEGKKQKLEEALSHHELYDDLEQAQKLQEEFQQVSTELESLYEEWMENAAEIE